MESLGLLTLVAIVLAALVVWRRTGAQRITKQRSADLAARQREIQSAIDSLGLKLKDSATTVQEGDQAMQVALAKLQAMDVQGDLAALITDTEDFFKEWRASKDAA